MELLLLLLAAVVGLGVFHLLASELGVDSRRGFHHPHALFYGSR